MYLKLSSKHQMIRRKIFFRHHTTNHVKWRLQHSETYSQTKHHHYQTKQQQIHWREFSHTKTPQQPASPMPPCHGWLPDQLRITQTTSAAKQEESITLIHAWSNHKNFDGCDYGQNQQQEKDHTEGTGQQINTWRAFAAVRQQTSVKGLIIHAYTASTRAVRAAVM